MVDDERAGRGVDELDPRLDVVKHVGRHHGAAEAGDAQQRRPPIRDRAEIVDEPAQRRLHLVEGADRHHQAAEGEVAREIDGRGHEDRGDEREPAIARGHPGQVGQPARRSAASRRACFRDRR